MVGLKHAVGTDEGAWIGNSLGSFDGKYVREGVKAIEGTSVGI